jgi:hypothetical protein
MRDGKRSKMRNIKPTVIMAAALALGGMALTSSTAFASPQGSRNTAIVLGAGAVYELTQHNNGAALILGLGAVVADQQSQRDNRYCGPDRDYHYDYRFRGNDHRFDNGYGNGGGNWDNQGNRGGNQDDRGNHGGDQGGYGNGGGHR